MNAAAPPAPAEDSPPLRWPSPWLWAVPLVGTAAALVIGLGGWNESLFRLDNGAAPEGSGADAWDVTWACITMLGAGEVAACLALPITMRRPVLLLAATLGALLVFGTTSITKKVSDVPRPPKVVAKAELHLIGPKRRNKSFPSAHTATVFMTAGLLTLALRRRAVGAGLVALAAVIGASRVVVGVHWPVDVCAGAAWGWVLAILAWTLAQRWRARLTPGVVLTLQTLLMIAAVVTLVKPASYPSAQVLSWIVGAVALLLGAPLWWRQLGRVRGTASPS